MLKEGRSVVIDDDGVKLFETRLVGTTSYEKFTKSVSLGMLETPVLPLGTIMVRYRSVMSAYFVQIPPKIRNIEYRQRDLNPIVFQLAFPWIVLGLKFQGNACVEVFARLAKSPILNMQSPLFLIPLPNSDLNGKRCMGPEFGMTVNTAQSIAEVAMNVVNYFDNSTYNRDLPDAVGKLPKEMLENQEIPVDVPGWFKIWAAWTTSMAGKQPLVAVNRLSWEPAESFGVFAGRLPI